MRLAAFAAAGFVLASAGEPPQDPAQESRQLRDNRIFSRQQNQNVYGDNRFHIDDSSNLRLPVNSDFYDDYNDIDYNMQDTSFTSNHKSKIPSMTYAKKEPSSPAMSAVALLGFLYFLNLIQNVLNGRKKRSVDEVSRLEKEEIADTNVLSYISTLEQAIQYFSEDTDVTEGRAQGTMRQRASGIISFFANMFDRIRSVFGFNQEPISRADVISNGPTHTAAPGFWSLLGKKIGMIATITDFLENPSPTRLKRAFTEYDRDIVDEGVALAEERELNEEELSFLPKRKSKKLSRRKRYTDDGMNVWYDIAQRSENQDIVIGPQQILGTIFNLLRRTVISSD